MNLWSVEHFFKNIFIKIRFFLYKFWLEENLILFNVLITGESNFDEKNVEEMFNWSEVHSEKKYYH